MNLIGNKYKKESTKKYLEQLLLNIKKSFNKIILKNNQEVNQDNKKELISIFIKNNLKEDKIDTIGKNLINCCLSNMTLENSRLWLNTYLPIAMNDLI
jgi:hypothetical protein